MVHEVIESVVRSWKLSGASTLHPGVAPEELANAGRVLGRSLPEELMALYTRCNGGDILGGNIQLYPISGSDLSLIEASSFLRRNNWPVPPEVVVFAGDGQGGSFGLWLSGDGGDQPLVVEVGEIFEECSLGLAGTSLGGFLRGRSAYYALLLEIPEDALGELGVPEKFARRAAEELNDDDYEAIMQWANSELQALTTTSYWARLTADDVRRLARRSG